MPSFRILALPLAVFIAAGCVTPEAPQDPPASRAPHLQLESFPVPLDHDHLDRASHMVSQGVEAVAFLRPMMEGGLNAPVYNLALAGDLLAASLASPTGGGALAPPMSLLLADVSDPETPRLLSVTPLPGGGVESVALSPDGRFAFLGTEFDGAVGVWTVAATDPEQPEILAFTPIPTEGPHNIRYGQIGDRHFIFASISHVATCAAVAGMGQDPLPVLDLRVDVLEFDPSQPTNPMSTVSSYTAQDTEGLPDGPAIVHDAILQVHPITGQAVLYVAHWDRGVRLVDVSTPEEPKEIGRFTETAPTDFLTIHTVKPHPTLIDGRHVTVATAQCAYTPASPCYVRLLDTTDPTVPRQIGTWTLPDTVHGPEYTTEIYDLADGRLVVPWMHGGTWVLDISNLTLVEVPGVLGYYFGSENLALPENGARTPSANAVVVDGDYAYLADVNTGIHVLRIP